jgi:hypothetical protein
VNPAQILALIETGEKILAIALQTWANIRNIPQGTDPEVVQRLDAHYQTYLDRIERAKRNADRYQEIADQGVPLPEPRGDDAGDN